MNGTINGFRRFGEVCVCRPDVPSCSDTPGGIERVARLLWERSADYVKSWDDDRSTRRMRSGEIMDIARIKSSTYENVTVDCPLCEEEVTLNRASDLNTLMPISGRRTSCPRCEGEFWLNGDTAAEKHEAIIFDCHDLLKNKKYMSCIVNVCQAYEMFFSLYLRVNLVYVPFGSARGDCYASSDRLNELLQELSRVTAARTFVQMRGIFLSLAINPNRPSDLDESEALINALRDYRCPKDAELESWPKMQISRFLMRVKRTRINELRNKVVHKHGYRPKRDEAERALKEARSVLFPLTNWFDLHDNINWYLKSQQ